MAKLDKTNIVTGNVITAADLANVYNALGGTGAADIIVSGTLSAHSDTILNSTVAMPNAPSSDPGIAGRLYTVSLSACFIGSSSGTILNGLGASSATIKTVLSSSAV
jgi:hypothetical protein